jgi:hypothetical protein
MAKCKDDKKEFILSWLKDTENAEAPVDDIPEEPIFRCETIWRRAVSPNVI